MLSISFSWDDGSPFDLRLASIFEKYGIPCVLFTPTFNKEGRETLSASDIKSVESDIVSFGGHTQNHVYLDTLSLENALYEIKENKMFLEDTLGKSIENFCFPGGKYTTSLLNSLESMFKTVRTAQTGCSNFDGFVRRPFFHFYPRGLKSISLNALKNLDKSFPLIISSALKTGDYFSSLNLILKEAEMSKQNFKINVWGHSWEIEELNLWDKLDALLNFIKNNFKESVYSGGY